MRSVVWCSFLVPCWIGLHLHIHGLPGADADVFPTYKPHPGEQCYLRYQLVNVQNKSIDFENPSVFELLSSNYSADRSPFFELLHRARDCITLSYRINDDPSSENYRGRLLFSCGVQELLSIDVRRNMQFSNFYCLSMTYADQPLERFGCSMLGLSHRVPLILQTQVGTMLILSQETPDRVDYLLFQRVTRYQDMLGTIRFFERRYNLTKGTVKPRSFFTSAHWLRCDCDQIMLDLAQLYQCLGVNQPRAMEHVPTVHSVKEDMLVMAAIGIGAGVTFFLLLTIRMIC